MSDEMRFEDHLGTDLDAWLDGRLSPERAARVERHLSACQECAELAQSLQEVQETVREGARRDVLPAGLEGSIRDLLDREDETRRNLGTGETADATMSPAQEGLPATQRRSSDRSPLRWRLLPAAAGLAFLALTWWFIASRMTTAPDSDPGPTRTQVAAVEEASDAAWVKTTLTAYEDVARALTGSGPDPATSAALPPDFRVTDGAQLEARWRAADPGFPARFIDLSLMGIEVIAGDVRWLGSRRATLAVYRGDADPIACWMFAAEDAFEAGLPTPVDRHRFGEFEFRVYREADVTFVVWREGGVICVLAGRGEPGDLVDLAHEKAMAPQTA